jgi:hypothetical protein
VFLCVFDSLERLNFLCCLLYSFVSFVIVGWILMDMSSMEEDQVMHDAI